jgi:hypothetical protein
MCSTSKAQNIYAFTYTSTPYAALTSPTVVVSNNGFTGTYQSIPLGFNFSYWGVVYTSFIFTTDAYCSFSAGSYGFYPFYTSLKGLGNSQIAYEISGIVGNRIAKIEWKNVGFMNDGTNTDIVSFQIWLYEGSNKVEIHFGSWTIQSSHFNALFSNTTGIQIAFSNLNLTSFYNLQGNPASPTSVYNPTSFLYINGYPSSGTVYIFTPPAPGVAPTSVFLAPSTGCIISAITTTNNSGGSPTPSYSWTANPASGVTFSPGNLTAAPQIIFTNVGSYTITCAATNSVASNSSSKIISIANCGVGIEETNLKEREYKVWSNPSGSCFNILTSSQEPVLADITILNSEGRLILKTSMPLSFSDPLIVDMNAKDEGLYVIRIDSGAEHVTKKVMLIK